MPPPPRSLANARDDKTYGSHLNRLACGERRQHRPCASARGRGFAPNTRPGRRRQREQDRAAGRRQLYRGDELASRESHRCRAENGREPRRVAVRHLRRPPAAVRCLGRDGKDRGTRIHSRGGPQVRRPAARSANRLELVVRGSWFVVRKHSGWYAVLLREFVCRVPNGKRNRARRLRRPVHRGGAKRKNLRRAVSSREIVGGRTAALEELRAVDVIPSIDLLQGSAVRLTRGDFTLITKYGEPEEVLDALEVEDGARLHVVDLEASRSGRPVETEIVRKLARRNVRLQVGGGIRTLRDARTWLDCGAQRIVVGTAAAESPQLLEQLVD